MCVYMCICGWGCLFGWLCGVNMKIKIDSDWADAPTPFPSRTQVWDEYEVVSIGQTPYATVVTFELDDDQREYGVIETGSVYFGGFIV